MEHVCRCRISGAKDLLDNVLGTEEAHGSDDDYCVLIQFVR